MDRQLLIWVVVGIAIIAIMVPALRFRRPKTLTKEDRIRQAQRLSRHASRQSRAMRNAKSVGDHGGQDFHGRDAATEGGSTPSGY